MQYLYSSIGFCVYRQVRMNGSMKSLMGICCSWVHESIYSSALLCSSLHSCLSICLSDLDGVGSQPHLSFEGDFPPSFKLVSGLRNSLSVCLWPSHTFMFRKLCPDSLFVGSPCQEEFPHTSAHFFISFNSFLLTPHCSAFCHPIPLLTSPSASRS